MCTPGTAFTACGPAAMRRSHGPTTALRRQRRCAGWRNQAVMGITATYWPIKSIVSSIGDAPDRQYACWRLLASFMLSAVGGVGLWSCVVILPAIQNEFGITRGGA